jgi:hypothetical protein
MTLYFPRSSSPWKQTNQRVVVAIRICNAAEKKKKIKSNEHSLVDVTLDAWLV